MSSAITSSPFTSRTIRSIQSPTAYVVLRLKLLNAVHQMGHHVAEVNHGVSRIRVRLAHHRVPNIRNPT